MRKKKFQGACIKFESAPKKDEIKNNLNILFRSF